MKDVVCDTLRYLAIPLEEEGSVTVIDRLWGRSKTIEFRTYEDYTRFMLELRGNSSPYAVNNVIERLLEKVKVEWESG